VLNQPDQTHSDSPIALAHNNLCSAGFWTIPICSPLASAIATVIVLLLLGMIITILTHSEIAVIISAVLCLIPLV
jgi:hypothetical protein